VNRALVIGVLGGMGPAATIDFMAEVLRLTAAEHEQDNLRLIVDSNPALPNRHAAIRGEGPSPGPLLAEMARGLERAGAELLVMPCNTAHAFQAEIEAATPLPFLSMTGAVLAEVERAHPQARRIGLLAADGCLDAGLYQTALADRGREAVVPDAAAQQRLMQLIFRIKRGEVGAEVRAAVAAIAQGLIDAGAQVLIAGCTEVPLALRPDEVSAPLINSTQVLARAAIERASQPR
jgi:aspartate racemase